jgi:hypothetical protein
MWASLLSAHGSLAPLVSVAPPSNQFSGCWSLPALQEEETKIKQDGMESKHHTLTRKQSFVMGVICGEVNFEIRTLLKAAMIASFAATTAVRPSRWIVSSSAISLSSCCRMPVKQDESFKRLNHVFDFDLNLKACFLKSWQFASGSLGLEPFISFYLHLFATLRCGGTQAYCLQ